METRAEARRLVDTYTPLIMRLGYTYLKSHQDAEDVCQETLIKLVRSHKNFKDGEHEKAWVIRVAINVCKDRLKAAERQRTVGLEAVADVMAGEPEIESPILEAVQSLPQDYREAICLHYSEGYKIAEIAKLTNKSNSAVAKSLSRGRAMLRSMLGVEF